MSKLSITVNGKFKQWTFNIDGKNIEQYRRDGLEIDVVHNTIPEWLPHWLVTPWVYIEDRINFYEEMNDG